MSVSNDLKGFVFALPVLMEYGISAPLYQLSEKGGLNVIQILFLVNIYSLLVTIILMFLFEKYESKEGNVKNVFYLHKYYTNSQAYVVLLVHAIVRTIYVSCVVISLLYINAGETIVLDDAAFIIFSMLLSKHYFDSIIGKFEYTMIVLAIGGIILVCNPLSLFSMSDNYWYLGFIYALFGGVFQSVCFLLKKLSNERSVSTVSINYCHYIMTQNVFACFIMGCILLFYQFDTSAESLWNKGTWKAHLFIVIVGFASAVSQASLITALKYGKLHSVGLVTLGSTLVTFILQVIVLNESERWIQWIGLLVIMLSLVSTQIYQMLNDVQATENAQYNEIPQKDIEKQTLG